MTPGILFLATLTAYSPDCAGCSGTTASGTTADPSRRIAATSEAWPLGSCVEVLLPGGEWVEYVVEDRLGPRTRALPGADLHLDLLVADRTTALAFGRQRALARRVSCREL